MQQATKIYVNSGSTSRKLTSRDRDLSASPQGSCRRNDQVSSVFISVGFMLLGLLLIIPRITTAQDYPIHEIRHEFYLSTLDYKYAFPLIDKLNKISNPNPLEQAYSGAAHALLAKSGWNIFKKIGYLRKSRDLLKQAINRDVTDVEIRFLRLSIEQHIPKYLGFSQHISEDKQVIMKYIHRFREKDLAREIVDYIILFSVESGIYTSEEIDNLKELLNQP